LKAIARGGAGIDQRPLFALALSPARRYRARMNTPRRPAPLPGPEDRLAALSCTRIPSPLKWHGGKSYLASRIVALMPPHIHYVEPFAGGLSVLLARDPEGVSEVVNDLDGGLTNFWRVLQGEDTFGRFVRILQATPFSGVEWQQAVEQLDHADLVQRAVAFFVHCRQSLAGRRQEFASISRTRTRRGRNEQVSAWTSAVEGLPAVHARLLRVVILEPQSALQVIRGQDTTARCRTSCSTRCSGTLFYLDPPYLHPTRATTGEYGEHEMSEADHRELLDVLVKVEGKVMLSGYPSAMYDRALAGWQRHTFDVPNNAAGGKAKGRETECLWCS
jgi:DNA adenine methylase